MGCSNIGWLVERMEAVFQAERQSDFIKHMHEGNKASTAQLFSKVHGRFLTVTEYGEGGFFLEGVVQVILKGHEGLGWKKFGSLGKRQKNISA